jgi:hypothetical protein
MMRSPVLLEGQSPGTMKDIEVLAQRNPLFLFLFSGSFLLRFAQRAFSWLLFHEPPRWTSGPIPSERPHCQGYVIALDRYRHGSHDLSSSVCSDAPVRAGFLPPDTTPPVS